MGTSTISHLVNSSQYRAVADDALKDEDNAAWVMGLPVEVREHWIERIGWIRLVDRLAENELLDPVNGAFQQFYWGWQDLLQHHRVEPANPHTAILTRMQTCWFQTREERTSQLSIQSWNQYLQAIVTYHQHQVTIATLADYETMLADLAGAFFQVLPFLSVKYWQPAASFGVIDQFYNNLRDLREDAEQGICYFPTELLQRFGVSREEILTLQATRNPGYYPMMVFWMDEYLPHLYDQAASILVAGDLHPSWIVLRDWCLHRYRRIERIFRACDFDYVKFPRLYWPQVKRDLNRMTSQPNWKLNHLPEGGHGMHTPKTPPPGKGNLSPMECSKHLAATPCLAYC